MAVKGAKPQERSASSENLVHESDEDWRSSWLLEVSEVDGSISLLGS
jgi:hypothetical protein